ncbi:protein TBATA isoform X1 [Misgurnus anguillicaudatus]|uniref:protein TBATA isoform X1 n=1 Tax=Misgurnus anguillicaudatus TaxID=75329 RepID=UPI003CCF4D31
MERLDERVGDGPSRTGVQMSSDSAHSKSTWENSPCETPGTNRSMTRGSHRFGSLSHHSFFSRHNPHPHRVKHIEGLNGKPVCMVNDDWYGYTPLYPHPLIKSQIPVSRSSEFLTPNMSSDSSGQRAVFLSESWREELKDLATKVHLTSETHNDKREKLIEEEIPRRKTQYSAQSGRIIPSTSWGKKRNSRTSHKRLGTQRQQMNPLEGTELRVLELLCQILQTDSLSMVQQWLLLADEREKELVQGLLQQAMVNTSAPTQQTSGSDFLPLTSDDVSRSSSVSQRPRKTSSNPRETSQDKPERIGEAEVLTIRPESTQPQS